MIRLALKTRISVPKLSHILVALCAFSIPIGSGINQITGFPFSKIFLASILLLMLYAIFFMKLKRYMNPLFIQVYIGFILIHTLVLYALLEPGHLKNDYYGELFYISLIRFFIYIFFFLFIIQFLYDKKLLGIFTLFYSLGYLFTFILGLFVPQSELDLGRINGGFENPNSFGASSLMLIFLNLYQFVLHPSEKGRKNQYLFFVLLGLAGLTLSQSRSAMAGLLGGIFFFVLCTPGLVKKFKIIISIIIGAGLILLLVPTDIIQHFIERANILERIGSKSESRIIIWTSYLHEFSEYWLFGVGRNQSNDIAAQYNLPANWQAPHNRYLFTLVEFGFIALLSFMLGLVQLFIRTYNRKMNISQALLVRSFFIAWLIMMLFGDYKNSRDFWLFLALITTITFISDNKPDVASLQEA